MQTSGRLCSHAGWRYVGRDAPKIILITDPIAEERIRGMNGGLMLVTEGAQRKGVPLEIVQRALMQRLVVMKLDEVVEFENIPGWGKHENNRSKF